MSKKIVNKLALNSFKLRTTNSALLKQNKEINPAVRSFVRPRAMMSQNRLRTTKVKRTHAEKIIKILRSRQKAAGRSNKRLGRLHSKRTELLKRINARLAPHDAKELRLKTNQGGSCQTEKPKYISRKVKDKYGNKIVRRFLQPSVKPIGRTKKERDVNTKVVEFKNVSSFNARLSVLNRLERFEKLELKIVRLRLKKIRLNKKDSVALFWAKFNARKTLKNCRHTPLKSIRSKISSRKTQKASNSEGSSQKLLLLSSYFNAKIYRKPLHLGRLTILLANKMETSQWNDKQLRREARFLIEKHLKRQRGKGNLRRLVEQIGYKTYACLYFFKLDWERTWIPSPVWICPGIITQDISASLGLEHVITRGIICNAVIGPSLKSKRERFDRRETELHREPVDRAILLLNEGSKTKLERNIQWSQLYIFDEIDETLLEKIEVQLLPAVRVEINKKRAVKHNDPWWTETDCSIIAKSSSAVRRSHRDPQYSDQRWLSNRKLTTKSGRKQEQYNIQYGARELKIYKKMREPTTTRREWDFYNAELKSITVSKTSPGMGSRADQKTQHVDLIYPHDELCIVSVKVTSKEVRFIDLQNEETPPPIYRRYPSSDLENPKISTTVIVAGLIIACIGGIFYYVYRKPDQPNPFKELSDEEHQDWVDFLTNQLVNEVHSSLAQKSEIAQKANIDAEKIRQTDETLQLRFHAYLDLLNLRADQLFVIKIISFLLRASLFLICKEFILNSISLSALKYFNHLKDYFFSLSSTQPVLALFNKFRARSKKTKLFVVVISIFKRAKYYKDILRNSHFVISVKTFLLKLWHGTGK